jgi:hypothetical protein
MQRLLGAQNIGACGALPMSTRPASSQTLAATVK